MGLGGPQTERTTTCIPNETNSYSTHSVLMEKYLLSKIKNYSHFLQLILSYLSRININA
jgi:hypothetical protein